MDTATFITVIGMWMLLIFGVMAIFLSYRQRRAALELNHTERMSALDRGLDPPAAYDMARLGVRGGYLQRGVVCVAAGVALMVALGVNVGWASAAWALLPVGFGAGCLVIHRLEGGAG